MNTYVNVFTHVEISGAVLVNFCEICFGQIYFHSSTKGQLL